MKNKLFNLNKYTYEKNMFYIYNNNNHFIYFIINKKNKNVVLGRVINYNRFGIEIEKTK